LVKRRDDKTVGRGVLVSTTPKGRRSYQRAQEQRLHPFAEVLDSLNVVQLASMRHLTSALERLTTLLDK
jgi:DNA-binding MarR family transcriptional regulator